MRKATKATRKKTAARRAVRPGAKAWTQGEVQELVRLYKETTAHEVGRRLGRSLASVKAKIRTLKLRKSAAARRRTVAGRRGGAARTAGRKTARRR
ncbi:MAG TPA: hypothetical protein PKW75_03510 [candidate division Zixibacteria bacterium]|nr:hypothetical protein [candidate division Zixibacteria bacterium]MDD4918800.1 hypothetical protein [candidate division Zixibacteria bacterium]MDM7973605.1 hypothetical protein [candidate division Zixibacteria bacterium]HOD65970.1 hypothetical protein [candidate division Zixibacteria bacterium]HOZ07332.1 hypothetical protein [candidate division Zixibacteria bacterium]